MKKSKFFLGILIISVSVLLVVFTFMYILDNNGKLNQGTFRVNDVMIKSSLDVYETQEIKDDEIKDLTDIRLSANQENTLSILVVSTVKPVKAYVDNVKISKASTGDVAIYSKDDTEIYSDNINVESCDIDITEKEDQYLLEIKINNMNLIEDMQVPDSVNEVIYDGRMLNTFGIKLSDIKFNIEFNINILDENNKLNTCKVKLTLPNDDIITNGVSVVRQPVTDYIFSVK